MYKEVQLHLKGFVSSILMIVYFLSSLIASNKIPLVEAVPVSVAAPELTCDQALFSFRSVKHSGGTGETKNRA